jgi:hypothetical protein
MTYIEAIKDGFGLVHRNWQLVLIQIGMVLVSSIGFFIVVGIPLAVAFIIFGLDLTGLTNVTDILRILKEPYDLVSRYLGLFLLVIASFLLYIIMVAMLGIYVFGGSIGVIGKAIKDRPLKFSMRTFFDEAKRLFLRVLGFTSIIGIIIIAAAFVLGVLGGGIAVLVSFARSQDSTLALFFGTFFSLIFFVIAIIFSLAMLLGIKHPNLLLYSLLSLFLSFLFALFSQSFFNLVSIIIVLVFGITSALVTIFGIAALTFKGLWPLKTLREAVNHLVGHPDAVRLSAFLFIVYWLVSFLVLLLSYSLTLIPVTGTILSFPYQLISYIFQTYLGLVVIAAVFSYYYSTEIPSEPAASSTP